MKLLLHSCCAPCSVACIAALRTEGIEPALFWYNPNIHLSAEYKKRRDTLKQYTRDLGLPLIMEDQYGLVPFLAGLYRNFQETPPGGVSPPLQEIFEAAEGGERCVFCYRLRLEKTAVTAKEQGFDSFSTTLLISPYQNHELLKAVALEAAHRAGTEFLYRDFRPHFREGQSEARRLGFYMQKYCGCIFSDRP
jgi:predicted adenine nucleotide alpha hydrolase (AANH) superfamily ATPase